MDSLARARQVARGRLYDELRKHLPDLSAAMLLADTLAPWFATAINEARLEEAKLCNGIACRLLSDHPNLREFIRKSLNHHIGQIEASLRERGKVKRPSVSLDLEEFQ